MTLGPELIITKKDRFHRLAEARARKVLDALRVLGHCSNSSLYSYTEKEIREIFQAIEKETKRIKSKFDKPAGLEFKLKPTEGSTNNVKK